MVEKCPACMGNGKHAFRSRDLMFDGCREFDYNECDDCGAVYQHPMPSLDEIATFYPDEYSPHQHPKTKLPSQIECAILKRYSGYNHLSAGAFRNLIAPIARRIFKNKRIRHIHAIRYVQGGLALDLGCGSGGFLHRLKYLGWDVQGVELNEAAAEICRNNGLDVFAGDLSSAGFADAAFDLVTAHDVIEHLPNPNEILREIARVMKPGGQLLIRTCNTRALGRAWFGKYWYPDDVPRHLVLYNADNLNRLVSRHGFSAIFASSWSDPKSFLNSFDYLAGNRGRPSSRSSLRKLLAVPAHALAVLLGRGDEIIAVYRKQA